MTSLPPDGLPALAVGSHRRPSEGACLMEFVSVLAGVRFTDRPRSTFPALRTLAQRVNDFTSDAGRPRLAMLAPDLAGAHGDRRRVRPATTAVVLCATASGLARAPHDRLLRRLHRTALDRRERDLGMAWRYPLAMAMQSVRTHLEDVSDQERDWYLHDLLARAVDESHLILDGTDDPVAAPGQPAAAARS